MKTSITLKDLLVGLTILIIATALVLTAGHYGAIIY